MKFSSIIQSDKLFAFHYTIQAIIHHNMEEHKRKTLTETQTPSETMDTLFKEFQDLETVDDVNLHEGFTPQNSVSITHLFVYPS